MAEKPDMVMTPMKTAPMHVTLQETGYLMALLWEKSQWRKGDPVAASLWNKMKAAAIEMDVEWYYGDNPFLPAKKTRRKLR